MGGVSAHNLDATSACLHFKARRELARALLCTGFNPTKNCYSNLYGAHLSFLLFAFAIPPFPHRILLWQPDFPSGFRGNGFYL
jgi:hypothetical protein